MFQFVQKFSLTNMNSIRFKTGCDVMMSKNDIDIWKIDPLDCKNVDSPLKSRSLSLKKSSGFRNFYFIDKNFRIPEGELEKINQHLQNVAHIWILWENKFTESEFRWGTPIKVGNNNGSLDKYPRMGIPTYSMNNSLSSKSILKIEACEAGSITISTPIRKVETGRKYSVEKKEEGILSKKTPMAKKEVGTLAKNTSRKNNTMFDDDDDDDNKWYEMHNLSKSRRESKNSSEDEFVIPDTEYPTMVTRAALKKNKKH